MNVFAPTIDEYLQRCPLNNKIRVFEHVKKEFIGKLVIWEGKYFRGVKDDPKMAIFTVFDINRNEIRIHYSAKEKINKIIKGRINDNVELRGIIKDISKDGEKVIIKIEHTEQVHSKEILPITAFRFVNEYGLGRKDIAEENFEKVWKNQRLLLQAFIVKIKKSKDISQDLNRLSISDDEFIVFACHRPEFYDYFKKYDISKNLEGGESLIGVSRNALDFSYEKTGIEDFPANIYLFKEKKKRNKNQKEELKESDQKFAALDTKEWLMGVLNMCVVVKAQGSQGHYLEIEEVYGVPRFVDDPTYIELERKENEAEQQNKIPSKKICSMKDLTDSDEEEEENGGNDDDDDDDDDDDGGGGMSNPKAKMAANDDDNGGGGKWHY